MAEQDEALERTEPASERRVQKAREEGQVVFSRDWVTFLLIGSGWLCVQVFQGHLITFCRDIFHQAMVFISHPNHDIGITELLRYSIFFF